MRMMDRIAADKQLSNQLKMTSYIVNDDNDQTLGAEIIRFEENAVPFDITPIAHYVSGLKTSAQVNLIRPPYRMTFWEFERSAFPDLDLHSTVTRIGVGLSQVEVDYKPDSLRIIRSDARNLIKNPDDSLNPEGHALDPRANLDHIYGKLDFSIIVMHSGVRLSLLGEGSIFVDQNYRIGVVPRMNGQNVGFMVLHPIATQLWLYGDGHDLNAIMSVPLFALSILNTKNVKEISVDTPPVPPKVAANRRKKTGRDAYVYKTLAIKPMGAKTKGQGHVYQPIDHRLHLARGHFKTFNPDRPLFGRHTGTYWWDSHVRGSKEVGKVIKDYKVQEPE